jgi:hypothetical protein
MRGRNPPFREQIRSRYFWLSMLAAAGTLVVWALADSGWLYALAVVLYLAGLVASAFARRDARAAVSRRASSDETGA